jgi:ectoine hydroxylase-related dioxygenase (phytanoyl-CoA dioxygenase family)
MPRGGCGVWLGSVFHAAGVNRTDKPRLGVALTFNLGWLRTIENQFLLLDPKTVAALPTSVQRLLGYDSHGVLGVHDWRSPMQSLLNA